MESKKVRASGQAAIPASETKNFFSSSMPKTAGLVMGTHYAALENPEDYACSINYARQNYSPMESMHLKKRG
jgi:hypothetical protein